MKNLFEIEKLRKKAKLLLILNMAVVVLATPFWPSPLSIALCVVAGILYLTVVKKKISNYKKIFKENIVKSSLSEVFSELSYEPNEGVSIEQVKFSELVELKDEFTSNDLMYAKYGKVKFKQADIVISEKNNMQGSSGIANEVTSVCFTGRFLVFDFLKPTVSPVKVIGKNFSSQGNSQKIMSMIEDKLINNKSKHQVYMESKIFNDNFKVFCDDPQTAFYILTPQIVEAITMISNQYQGKIALCFREKMLLVAISSKKDSLEANLLSNYSVWKQQELVLKDIKVITDFIDLMNLENNALVVAPN